MFESEAKCCDWLVWIEFECTGGRRRVSQLASRPAVSVRCEPPREEVGTPTEFKEVVLLECLFFFFSFGNAALKFKQMS